MYNVYGSVHVSAVPMEARRGCQILLELELPEVVCYHTGSQTQVLCKSNPHF